jgi:hypothetical protein
MPIRRCLRYWLPARTKPSEPQMVGYPSFRYQRLALRKPPVVNWA